MVWCSASALVLINKVNLCRAWLVLGRVTMSEFDSRGLHLISAYNRYQGQLSLLPSMGQ